MATAIIMPRQGQSVESCIIGQWHKKVGDPVKVGDLLFTYETDKATFDEAAKADGVLLAAFFDEGDDVPCLTNVCVVGQPGESFAEFDPRGVSASSAVEAPPSSAPPSAAPAPVMTPAPAPGQSRFLQDPPGLRSSCPARASPSKAALSANGIRKWAIRSRSGIRYSPMRPIRRPLMSPRNKTASCWRSSSRKAMMCPV